MKPSFFTAPSTDSDKFKRKGEAVAISETSAVYYNFSDYSDPENPTPSKMVICRNEEDRGTTIITPRLLFRSLNQISNDDLKEGYQKIFEDGDNLTKFRHGRAWTKKEIDTYIETNRAAWEQGKKFSVYAVYDVLNPNDIIGTLNLYEKDSQYKGHENAIELGYVLNISKQGKKIGREIGEVAWIVFIHEVQCAITSGTLPRDQLVATAHPDNPRSIAILNHILGQTDTNIQVGYGTDQPRDFFFRSHTELKIDDPTNFTTQTTKMAY